MRLLMPLNCWSLIESCDSWCVLLVDTRRSLTTSQLDQLNVRRVQLEVFNTFQLRSKTATRWRLKRWHLFGGRSNSFRACSALETCCSCAVNSYKITHRTRIWFSHSTVLLLLYLPARIARTLIQQFAFKLTSSTKMNSMMPQQQPQQLQQINDTNQLMKQQKMVKAVKTRRSRQPKNPQVSVARRNERERNRVRQVNDGFAKLRQHLPVDEQVPNEHPDSFTPTPESSSKASQQAAQKARKYSKVETLRAAIKYIRELNELMLSIEPNFQCNLVASTSSSSDLFDDEQLSVCAPLSCSSSSQSNHQLGANYQHQLASSEQFIKLEPHQMMSPSEHSLSSNTSSGLNQHQHQPQPQPQQQPMMIEHQRAAQQLAQDAAGNGEQSHTHLWLEQHQSSFIEQQQFHQQQQTWYSNEQPPTDSNWISQQHQHQHQPQPSQQPQQVDSPIWFQSADSPASQQLGQSQHHQQHLHSQQQQMSFNQHLNQHQISLYSQ